MHLDGNEAPGKPGTKIAPPACMRYIDDSLIIEKINMKVPPLLTDLNGKKFKSVNPS